MGTVTARLGLYKPTPVGETVNVTQALNENWDKLDKYAGSLLVNNGVTPADSQLYDGVIVREKTSGKVWMAQKNNLGTFDKLWLSYPWLCVANYDPTGLPNDSTFRAVPVTQLTGPTSGNINSTGAVSAGRIVIPIKGEYIISAHMWFAAGAGLGNRALKAIDFVGATSDDNLAVDVREGVTTNSTTCHVTTTRVLAAGTALTSGAWQTSGGILNVTQGSLRVSLKQPIDE